MNAITEKVFVSTQPNTVWFDVHPALGITMMEHLFNRLDGAYPHKWRSAFANQQAIANWEESWAEAFEEEGITPELIKAGMKAVRSRCAWPPSCAEFIQACKPSIDFVVAYYEALNGIREREAGEVGEWSHPAIFWAAVKCGTYDLKTNSYSQMKTKWEMTLKAQLALDAWEPIQKPVRQIAGPGKSVTSNDDAKKKMEEMGLTNGFKIDGRDGRQWAFNIKAREKNGDRTLTSIQIQFANQALSLAA